MTSQWADTQVCPYKSGLSRHAGLDPASRNSVLVGFPVTTLGRKPSPNFPRGTDSGVSLARQLAVEILALVASGGRADEVLSAELQEATPRAEDRRLATELVYGVLRWRTRLDAIIGRCLLHPHKKVRPRVRDILRIALYQMIFLDRIPQRAAVHQAVAQTKACFGERLGAFVNGLLMNAARSLEVVDPAPGPEPGALAAFYSHPDWLVRRWLKDYGLDQTIRTLTANNSRPRLIVRANRLKISPEKLFAFLTERSVLASAVLPYPDAMSISTGGLPISEVPGYGEGFFTVHESASQLVSPLLGALPGERILDACAAPGGKTSHLASLVANRAQIIAVDIDGLRLKQTEANLRRLGAACVECKMGDVADESFVLSLGGFDRILIDAPCSNLGVLRHNPEVKYRMREEDALVFARKQGKILRTASSALRPGGTLVYSVCATTHEETSGVITEFLVGANGYVIDTIEDYAGHAIGTVGPDGCLRTFPLMGSEPVDGFFAARLSRKG